MAISFADFHKAMDFGDGDHYRPGKTYVQRNTNRVKHIGTAIRNRRIAYDRGLEIEWRYDDDPSWALEDHAEWCNDAKRRDAGYLAGDRTFTYYRTVNGKVAHWTQAAGDRVDRYTNWRNECDHSVEGCIVTDPATGESASVWGVVDAWKHKGYMQATEDELITQVLVSIRDTEQFADALTRELALV